MIKKSSRFMLVSTGRFFNFFGRGSTGKRRKHFLSLSCLVLLFSIPFLLAWVLSLQSAPSNNAAYNLISGQNWADLAGASQQNGTVRVLPLGRKIVNQDGSGGQSNPPVNVRGPHLSVSGDFTIEAKLSSIPPHGAASILLYGGVPIIYDEWRYQSPQIKIDVSGTNLQASIWNGTGDEPIIHKSWYVSTVGAADLKIIYQHKQISFFLNGKSIGKLASYDIFKNHRVWFGLDATTNTSGWSLTGLSAQALGKGWLIVRSGIDFKSTSQQTNQSIRSLASSGKRQLPIGAAVAGYALFSDEQYRNIVVTQFSIITPENEMKPQFIHPQPNVYSFTESDSLVNFALANSMLVHGHTLVFSEANPAWMQRSLSANRQKILTDHVKTVVSHFQNKVSEWDVVNEPLGDSDSNNGNSSDLRQNIWYTAMGEKYLDTAFKAAREANPKAKLFINEYGLEADGPRWEKFLSLVRRLRDRNVSIDGVGFQAHVYEPEDKVDPLVLKRHIKTLAGMGLISRVSELDVYGDSPSEQAKQYSSVLSACLALPSCTSFTTWGVSDKYGSTTTLHEYPLDYGNDLIWGLNLKPKKSYTAILDVLRSY